MTPPINSFIQFCFHSFTGLIHSLILSIRFRLNNSFLCNIIYLIHPYIFQFLKVTPRVHSLFIPLLPNSHSFLTSYTDYIHFHLGWEKILLYITIRDFLIQQPQIHFHPHTLTSPPTSHPYTHPHLHHPGDCEDGKVITKSRFIWPHKKHIRSKKRPGEI